MLKKTIALLITLALGFCTYLGYLMFWGYKGEETTFKVSRGEGFSSINYRLAKNSLISSPRLFHYLVRYKGSLGKFKAGTFTLNPGDNMFQVFETLVNGKGNQIVVTVPEGKNLYQIAEILEAAKICSKDKFIALALNQDFLNSIGHNYFSAEGYLYPDTYHFEEETPEEDVLARMIKVTKTVLADLDFSNTKLNPHQTIILASIVEKETGAPFERPIISGVFHNRLRIKMRLQSDPTTIYGIWNRYDGNLRKRDLLQKTPYNTYKIPGLPIGPISNPGKEAILATLNPQKHRYLYFVSKNDGTHIFSENYKKHVKAVNYYQKTRANREGKSWRDFHEKQQNNIELESQSK